MNTNIEAQSAPNCATCVRPVVVTSNERLGSRSIVVRLISRWRHTNGGGAAPLNDQQLNIIYLFKVGKGQQQQQQQPGTSQSSGQRSGSERVVSRLPMSLPKANLCLVVVVVAVGVAAAAVRAVDQLISIAS